MSIVPFPGGKGLQPPTGGDNYDDMEHRVAALEKTCERLDTKLDRLMENLAAARADLGEIKGKVGALPTTGQMITLVFGILGGAFLILKFGLPAAG